MTSNNKINLPNFEIDIKQSFSNIEKIIEKNKLELEQQLAGDINGWDLIYKLDELDERFNEYYILAHLNMVNQTPELNEVHNKCLAKFIAYSSALSQNKLLFNAIKTLSQNNETFDYAQKACLTKMLKEFQFGGMDLPDADRKRYQIVTETLSESMNEFAKNVLNATDDYSHLIVEKEQLKGLPEAAILSAEKAARDKNLKGYLFTLHAPSYLPVMQYADNRMLRETLFIAYNTLASELSNNKAYDNSQIIYNILKLRYEQSQLLGFNNYVEFSLALNKMAETPEQVVNFLNDLGTRAKPQALEEWNALRTFAFQHDQIETLEPWDITYYQEKLREKNFAINHEALRDYFPIDKVLDGLFKLIRHLFGMQIEEVTGVNTWDVGVRCFSITDRAQQIRGHFYLDPYARPGKQPGAWTMPFQPRRRLSDGTIQTPIGFIVCNFDPPTNSTSSLLRHSEIVILFHEMGHCLHQVVTQIDYPTVTGLNVLWDAVELPSQTMQSFPEEKPILSIISEHKNTKECLSGTVIDQIQKAKNFNSGMRLLTNIDKSLFDFRLHLEFDPVKGYQQIQSLWNVIHKEILVIPTASFDRFQHKFLHIFAGGYAAGFYSYIWAEVLSCDVFAKFLEEGLFNEKVGQAFLHTVLEQGGAKHPLVLFEEFRGRQPKLDALLNYRGIGQAEKTNLPHLNPVLKTTPVIEDSARIEYEDFYSVIEHNDVIGKRRDGFKSGK